MKEKIIKYKQVILGLILVLVIVLLDQANYFSFVSHPILNFLGKDYLQALLFIPILVWVMSQVWTQAQEDINHHRIPEDILFLLAISLGSIISYVSIFDHQPLSHFNLDLKPIFGVLATLIFVKVVSVELIGDWQLRSYLQRKVTLSEIRLNKKIWISTSLILLTTLIATSIWIYTFQPSFNIWISVLLASLLIVPTQVLLVALTGLISQAIRYLESKQIELINHNRLADLARLKMVIFDQMGTLMLTKLEITNLVAAKPNVLLKLSASLEQSLNHPIATALLEEAKRKKVTLEEVDKFKFYPGLGVVGWVKNQKIVLGNMALMRQESIVVGVLQREKSRLEKLGNKVIVLGISYNNDRVKQKPGEVIGLITLSHEIRPGIKNFIQKLHQLEVETWVLTGESQVSAEVTGAQLSIDADHILAGVLPNQKQAIVQELVKRGGSGRTLAVVGGLETKSNNLFMGNNISIYLSDNNELKDKDIDVTIKDGQVKKIEDLLDVVIKVDKKISQNQLWVGAYSIIFLPLCWGVFNFNPVNLIFWPVPAILSSGLMTAIILINSSLYLKKKGE